MTFKYIVIVTVLFAVLHQGECDVTEPSFSTVTTADNTSTPLVNLDQDSLDSSGDDAEDRNDTTIENEESAYKQATEDRQTDPSQTKTRTSDITKPQKVTNAKAITTSSVNKQTTEGPQADPIRTTTRASTKVSKVTNTKAITTSPVQKPAKNSTKSTTPKLSTDSQSAPDGTTGMGKEENQGSDCFSLTRPTAFTLLVLALCFICLLFIYTIVCSCVLARRRVYGNLDVESPPCPQPEVSEKAQKEAKKKEEAAKKKETKRLKEEEKKEKERKKAEEKKEQERKKAEEKKKKQEEKEQKKKLSKEQKETKKEEQKKKSEEKVENDEKTEVSGIESASQEQSIEMKEVEEKTAGAEAEVKTEPLQTIQEVNVASEAAAAEAKSEEAADKGEVRVSSLPPPPPEDTDSDQPSPIQADVVVETLPPPPPPDDNELDQRPDTVVEAVKQTDDEEPEAEVKSETAATAPLATEEDVATDHDKAVDNLAEAGMRLDEVLKMLDTVRQ